MKEKNIETAMRQFKEISDNKSQFYALKKLHEDIRKGKVSFDVFYEIIKRNFFEP